MLVEGLLVQLALSGRLQREELRRWLSAARIGERAAVLAFELPDPLAAVEALEGCLERADAAAVAGAHEGLLCAIVDAPDPVGLANRCMRGELRERFGAARAAASRTASIDLLSQSFNEARSALRAVNGSSDGDGSPRAVATYEDLGALQLLLALEPRQALESYCQAVLGPVEDGEHAYNEELLRSLDAFIEYNGHWERASRALYCHRHTLRYRIRRVEALTKRDFSRARDRIELWLALRGRELVR